MQIKLFTIPVEDEGKFTAELNIFLRGQKVLELRQEFVKTESGALWCFLVKYIPGADTVSDINRKGKVDYKLLLDAESFNRFSRLREIRKEVALAEAVPPYAVFIDEELAELSKLSELTAAGMLLVKGIGTKKVERYGQLFINALNNEKSGATDRKDS